MNPKTFKITYGAMIIAIFAVLLLLNRQTGGLLENTFLFLFPIPMVAYSARYGFRSSIPVWICMSLTALLFGTFTSIFYAISEAIIGMVFGASLYHRQDINRTVVLVMVLSAIANVVSTVVLASLFGYDINRDIQEMQQMMQTVAAKAGTVLPETVFSTEYLRRIFVLSMVLMGMIQGLIIYEVSLLLLRRLGIPVQKPRPLSEFYPPRWSGYVSFALMILYFASYAKLLQATAGVTSVGTAGGTVAGTAAAAAIPSAPGQMPEFLWSLLQTAGLCGYIYLAIFGMAAAYLACRRFLVKSRLIAFVLAFFSVMLLPQLVMLAGFSYISGGLHAWLLKENQ